MAQILGPGETLGVGEKRTDETGRFELILQPDGNLVIYAHVLKPTLWRRPTGHTGTWGVGADVELHLTPTGVLQLRRKSSQQVLWHMPNRICTGSRRLGDEHCWWYPFSDSGPEAGSTLHLQDDGNLCLYRKNIVAGNVSWTMGDLSIVQSQAVRPDALILKAPQNVEFSNATNSNALAIPVINETGRIIEAVTDDGRSAPIQVQPNSQIGVIKTDGTATNPGALTIYVPHWWDQPGRNQPEDGGKFSIGLEFSNEQRAIHAKFSAGQLGLSY